MSATPATARNPGERRLYTAGAVLAALVAFAGFARTYYLKGSFGSPDLTPILHAHGLVMTLWFVLFIAQARLVAMKSTNHSVVREGRACRIVRSGETETTPSVVGAREAGEGDEGGEDGTRRVTARRGFGQWRVSRTWGPPDERSGSRAYSPRQPKRDRRHQREAIVGRPRAASGVDP